MGYRNIEWYSDLTTGTAMERIRQEKKGKAKMEQGIIWALLGNEDWREDENREGIIAEKT